MRSGVQTSKIKVGFMHLKRAEEISFFLGKYVTTHIVTTYYNNLYNVEINTYVKSRMSIILQLYV